VKSRGIMGRVDTFIPVRISADPVRPLLSRNSLVFDAKITPNQKYHYGKTYFSKFPYDVT